METNLAEPVLRAKRDIRLPALLLVVLVIAVIGYLVTMVPLQNPPAQIAVADERTSGEIFVPVVSLHRWKSIESKSGEVAVDLQARTYLFDTRRLLDENQHQQAKEYLNKVRPDIQHLPDSLMLMGEALLGLQDYETARDFFNAAIDRDPSYDDAYYGYAMAAEGVGELEEAIGAMRSYLHLQKDDDSIQIKRARARSAIWEWNTALGRGEWGPTKGIPPGFTAEEIRRDGRGAGTKMPIAGTEDEHGNTQYTIKHSDIIRMYKK
jgi:tetratricopeptide (TPR) repeat protein